MTSESRAAPVVIDTTAEELPPPPSSRRALPARRRANVVPFAATLRHLAPDTPFVGESP